MWMAHLSDTYSMLERACVCEKMKTQTKVGMDVARLKMRVRVLASDLFSSRFSTSSPHERQKKAARSCSRLWHPVLTNIEGKDQEIPSRLVSGITFPSKFFGQDSH